MPNPFEPNARPTVYTTKTAIISVLETEQYYA
jgi:hypothetical protein